MAVFLKARAEPLVVLDDPVVDHGEPAGAIEVGVSVSIAGRAVRRPPRVAHGGRPGGRPIVAKEGLQRRELAGALANRNPAVDQRDPRRVVTAVLEPAKSLQHDGKRLVGTRVTDDAAHGLEGNSGPGSPPPRPRAAPIGRSRTAVSSPSPVVASRRKMTWPLCSPPSERPRRSISSKTYRSPTFVVTTSIPC